MKELSDKHLGILQHAIGVDQFGEGRRYRNYYVASPGHHSFSECRDMVELGLMAEHAPRPLFGNGYCFTVTDSGQSYVTSHSPAPPKLTRSQRRYLEFLEWKDALGGTFLEFLREMKIRKIRD